MLDVEKEHMFDSDSFGDEITSASEAQAAYNYFAHNLTDFRHQLASEGKGFSASENTIRQCWANLIKSSQRVGYMNGHMQRIAKSYNIGINRAIPSSEDGD